MKILVTGGAGYIGSITSAVLRQNGHEVVIFDNLQLGHKSAIGESRLIVGDLTNLSDITQVLQSEPFDVVIHFAAYSLAGESMQKPHAYFQNNIMSGLNLMEAMRLGGCNRLIFSSTSSVYGYPKEFPVKETAPINPLSVYGASKRMVEELIFWYQTIYGMKSVILRYFNAAGAMLDGSLGEAHTNESHIIPLALQVAAGKRDTFEVYGKDYETSDGTCIRDYIHVLDLASAHMQAAEYLLSGKPSDVFNLGVGRGYSNKEVLDTIQTITGKPVPHVFKDRRPGDPACVYADNTKAKTILGWLPKHSDLTTIIASAWTWHTTHPNGYKAP